MLSPSRREELADKIRKVAKEVHFVEIPAKEIDGLRSIMSLNEVEAKKIAELVLSFKEKPKRIIVDCPDTDTSVFVRRLHKYLGKEFELVVEHKADVNHPIVSAASIIAKVERDKVIERLKKRYGEIGSGYPSDPLTQKFLNSYFEEHGKMPPEVRKSWDTSKRIEDKKYQRKLNDFNDS